MKIENKTTDEAVLAELGVRLARVRLERNLTQAELAERAGVSKRTVERLESGGAGGEGTRLSALIRVCRAFEVLDRLEMMFPEVAPSPMMQLKLAGRRRLRASGTRKPTPPGGPSTWTWGEKA